MTTSHDLSVMCHCITKMMQQYVPIGDSMSSGAPQIRNCYCLDMLGHFTRVV